MTFQRTLAPVILSAALCASAAFAAAQTGQAKPTPPPVTLHVGDPAPDITVMKWLKGHPVNLKDGRVHVVEFWATWCGPCKIGMPHLSELATKYSGKVEFAGISVWESRTKPPVDTMPKVESFVNHAHDMMAYNVAADGTAAVMAETWMTAAGQHGIPASFVVDQSGKIAWIGHPLLGLEDVLPLVIAHKFDAAAAAKVDADWKDKMAKGQELYKQLAEAQKANDNAKVLTLDDQVLADLPYMVGFWAPTKYIALANTDPAAASKFAQDLMVDHANAPIVLSAVANSIADDKSAITGKRDYALALKLMNAAEQCMEVDWNMAQTYAMLMSKTGNASGAAKYQADVVKSLTELGAPTKMIEDAQKKLDEYKAAANHQG